MKIYVFQWFEIIGTVEANVVAKESLERSETKKYSTEFELHSLAASKVHPFLLTPFGHGTRMCAGRRYVFLLSQCLLSFFQFRYLTCWQIVFQCWSSLQICGAAHLCSFGSSSKKFPAQVSGRGVYVSSISHAVVSWQTSQSYLWE